MAAAEQRCWEAGDRTNALQALKLLGQTIAAFAERRQELPGDVGEKMDPEVRRRIQQVLDGEDPVLRLRKEA